MKKILSLFLAAVFMFLFIPETISPMVFEAAESSVSQLVDGVYYKIDGDHAVVTGCDAVASAITVRAKYKDYPVTEIADSAFKNAVLEKVTLSDGITKIGASAFENCTKLTEITIPQSVTSIGVSAFGSCTGLKKVNITNIAKWCSVNFAEKLSNPLYYAHDLYLNGTKISALTIPVGVRNISKYAFYGCSGLTSVKVTSSVRSISESAFFDCSGLTSVTILNGVTSIGKRAFVNCSGLTSITIPSSITSIGEYAFAGCKGLKRVDITDLAKWCEIDFADSSSNPLYYAHSLYLNGTKITSLLIPASVTNIKNYAFSGGSEFTSINIPGSVTSIGNSVFENCMRLTEITIPQSVTSIGNAAFENCRGLENITIPDGVKSIGYYTFYNCTELKNVTIPDSVTSIGNGAFLWCSGLTSITIPDSVTSIGDSAFSGCDGLTNITIPDSVTSIGKNSFSGCEDLVILTSEGSYADTYAKENNIPVWYLSETPDSPILKEYKYDKANGKLIITVDQDDSERFEYSTDCVTWQKDPVLEVKINSDGKYKVYQRVAATLDYNESFPSKPTIIETAPVPTVSSVTETSVILNPTAGFEYRMDNGEWQDSNIFDNLPVNSTHNFYQRKKATSTSLAGLESSPVSVTTLKHEHTAVGGWQTDASGHYKLCSCGQKFDSGKHSGGEATCSSVAVCEICGTSYGEKNLTNHKNTEIRGKVAATCSKEGYSGDTYCLDCGEKIVSGKTLDKLKHNYKDEVVPPTFGKQGYTLHTCTLCGDTYKDNYTSYVPSETDPVIKVSSVCGILGNQVKVAVSLKNNPGIVSMALQLNYDENVLKLINVEDCGALGTQVHSPTLGTPYYLNWVNDTATANFTANGDIVILTFEVLENAALGKTAVTVSYTHDNYEIYDKDGTEVNFAVESGYVDVSDILIGDVNGDGVVNGKDRLLLTRWLANWPEAIAEGINEAAADVNCDGKVNGLDRLILTRHLARWEEYATLPYTK